MFSFYNGSEKFSRTSIFGQVNVIILWDKVTVRIHYLLEKQLRDINQNTSHNDILAFFISLEKIVLRAQN